MRRKAPAQPNQSLQDGIACLQTLVTIGRPVGCRELARMLGMDHTRTNRLLGTLAYLELADQTSDRKYIPGPGLHLLAALSLRGSHLLTCALPVIRELQEETGATVAMGVIWHDKVCYYYHGNAGSRVEASIAEHKLFPVEDSSLGLILLAHKTDEEIREALSHRPVDEAQPDMDELLRHVRAARRTGYALHPSRTSVAVTVGEPPVAALAVAKADEAYLKRVVPTLQEAARRISEAVRDAQQL